ncbi:MAG: GWxTD domain-containing protein [Bacteroidota bacterium]
MKTALLTSVLLLIFFACNTYVPASKTNVSLSYNPEKNELKPEIGFYHISRDSTMVYLKQARVELTYDDELSSRLLFKTEILPGKESNKLIDSSSVILYDTLDGNQGNYLMYQKKIELPSGHAYSIKTTVTDLNKEASVWHYHTVSKTDAYQRRFFKLTDKAGNFRFSNLIDKQDTFRIAYDHADQLTVRYFLKEFKPSRPPHLNKRKQDTWLKTDSIFTIDLTDGLSPELQFHRPGIYHIQADTTQKDGLSLFYFRDNYPLISNPRLMIAPTQYIATSFEFRKIKQNESPKKAIDQFWLKITDNPERAKILIRKYYTRVEHANRMFYTHRPGWKTDRGMIYIVLGPPQLVYRSNNNETWIYGESAQYNALKLNFTRVDNPFSNNDFALERSPLYKEEWYFAIDMWRR